MKNKVLYLLAVGASLLLGACAGPGAVSKIPLTMPDGEKATIIAHDQQVPEWMMATDKLALNYIVKGEVSEKQLRAVAEAERSCRIYTNTVRPSNLVAVVSSGVLYATTGFIGLGLAANAFPAAKPREYAKYGAAAGALGGVGNGIVNLGGKTYTFENCGTEIFIVFPAYQVRVLRK